MVVLIVSAVKPGLRGELTRWMIEPEAGVFVGRLSARVRQKLWEKVVHSVSEGSAMMISASRKEQGFDLVCHGDRDRLPVDFDGMTLISRRLKPKKG